MGWTWRPPKSQEAMGVVVISGAASDAPTSHDIGYAEWDACLLLLLSLRLLLRLLLLLLFASALLVPDTGVMNPKP